MSVSQPANPGTFTAQSADSTVATFSLSTPSPGSTTASVQIFGHKAGTTTITVAGAAGATAQVTTIVTSIGSLTVTGLAAYPSAKTLFIKNTPSSSAGCGVFGGGINFTYNLTGAVPSSLTFANVQASGSSGSGGCPFNLFEVKLTDASNAVLIDKTGINQAITIGANNTVTLSVP